jgi:nucleoside-diphosphate-sugar epimerase
LESGFSLRVFDRQPDAHLDGCEYVAGDINDYPALRQAVRGCGAIVHLAALPRPCDGPSPEVFRINAAGTFNVFQAAAEEGIRRVVQASSINAIGHFYGVKEAAIQYLPIDEGHPAFTTDAYSFSKEIVEQIGEYYWRREGISSVALRFPAVLLLQAHERIRERRANVQRLIQRLLAMSPQERLDWLAERKRAFNDFRARRSMESAEIYSRMWAENSPLDAETRLTMIARYNFFAIIDERDAARALEKGLTAAYEGSHALFVNDRINSAGVEAQLLAEVFFPEVKAFRRPLSGMESLVSIERARQVLGFEPAFSFSANPA